MLGDFLHAVNHFEVEGFFHTSSRKRYLIRILEAAAITWAGKIIINLAFHNVDPVTHKMTIYSILEGNNILVNISSVPWSNVGAWFIQGK